jgi:hypothetical protein
MRERWDSRRCFERHNITLQTAAVAVNASERSVSCNIMILYGYIYFSEPHARLIKEAQILIVCVPAPVAKHKRP